MAHQLRCMACTRSSASSPQLQKYNVIGCWGCPSGLPAPAGPARVGRLRGHNRKPHRLSNRIITHRSYPPHSEHHLLRQLAQQGWAAFEAIIESPTVSPTDNHPPVLPPTLGASPLRQLGARIDCRTTGHNK